MNTPVAMIISDSCFCRQIINKYKQHQRKSFSFPLMIFRKKAGRITGHPVHMYIRLQVNSVGWKRVSVSILKNVQDMQGLFSWFGSEKYIFQPISRSAMSKRFTSVNKILPHISHESTSQPPSAKNAGGGDLIDIRSIPSVIRRSDHMGSVFKKLRRSVLKTAEPVFCFPAASKDLLSNVTVIRQRYNAGRIFQRIGFDRREPSSPEEKGGKIFPAVEHLLSAVLPSIGLLLNRRCIQDFQKWVSADKLSIKHHQYITGDSLLSARREKRLFESLQTIKPVCRNLTMNERKLSADRNNNFESEAAARPISASAGTVLKPESVNLYFNTQRMIENEVREIKKIIVKTNKEVKEKIIPDRSSLEMDIKKHFDINRLSDQVYRNIEQRIRIERERRGL